MTHAAGPGVARLTREQLAAIASPLERIFIEAEPGSGKTTVAALRFGALRFGTAAAIRQPRDTRAVIGLSFTRSATAELRGRVLEEWGRPALRRPHRVVTIDTLIYELVEYLLVTGTINWPGGFTALDVRDSWASAVKVKWGGAARWLDLADADVVIKGARTNKERRPVPREFEEAINGGICTHDDVRLVLEAAMTRSAVRSMLTERLKATVRAAIIDEIFDGNRLDLNVVVLLMHAGVQVTLVGDPWQALYGFRGAKPDLVPDLLQQTATATLRLSATFRWKQDEQRNLADALRAGEAVTLPQGSASHVDVVLAPTWNALWEADVSILPLAFGSFKGSIPEAAATLLLSCMSRRNVLEESPFVSDALSALKIDAADFETDAEAGLHQILELLRETGKEPLNDAYMALVDLLSPLSDVPHPKPHFRYRDRLGLIRDRLRFDGQLVLGMTAHQAKGREWDVVGVALTPEERATLAVGISSAHEPQRQLYVACTRARSRTWEV